MAVATVEQAAGAVHCSLDKMIKTVIFIDAKNETYAAIVRGDDRVSMSRMSFGVKLDGLRMAKSEEVLARTGFSIGAVPPLGFSAHFILDEKIPDMQFCWGGGGSDKALVKLTPKDIIEHTKAQVVRITV